MTAATALDAPAIPDIDLAYPRTATDFRNAIGGRLILGTVDGQRWASNNYYVAPAERFALAEGLEDGCYSADGKAWSLTGDGADKLLEQFLSPADYTEPVELETLHGRPAIIAAYREPERPVDEVLVVPYATDAGLNARYLRLLTNLEPLNHKSYGDRLSRVHLRQHAGGPQRPVGIFADVEKRHGGHRDTTTDAYRWIPETFEPAGDRLIGVLMPVRLSA